jgi:hypothetical protein
MGNIEKEKNMRKHGNKVQLDSKHRVSLGNFLSEEERAHLSSFRVYRQDDGKIVLDPLIEVSARDHWIYKNPKALSSLMEGIEDAKAGRIKDRGSFAKYAKEDQD